MELLQDKISGHFSIRADGTAAAESETYFNHTDTIGSWIIQGLALTDGKVVKAEVKRIVELEEGVNLDVKFLSLDGDDLKKIVGQELLFELLKNTLVPAIMTEDEYVQARGYRHTVSSAARADRWDAMMKEFSNPSVLVSPIKVAFLAEDLKKYKDDYVLADNKIFESFIAGVDHPLSGVAGYRLHLDFATAGKNLSTSPLWAIGGADQPHKDLIIGIIQGCIIDTSHYIIP